MGLLDQLGGLTGGGGGGLGSALQEILGGSGGLDGLAAKFDQAGLGELVKGWISTGPNPAVSPGQLEQVLGSAQVRDLAARFGLPLDQLLGGLSNVLPQAVDGLTPDGRIPAGGGDTSVALGGLLGRILGRS